MGADITPIKQDIVTTPEDAFSEEQIALVRKSIAPELNDAEFRLYLAIAGKYALDPLRGEIWPARMGGKFVPIVGRDGLLSIAQRHSDYRGWDGDVVREYDSFKKVSTPDGPVVEHSYEVAGKKLIIGEENKLVADPMSGAKRGEIVGAWAIVYREGRHPTYFFAPWGEYNKSQNAWRSNPTSMILKAALSHALKLAFNLSGLYVDAELHNAGTKDALTEAPPEPEWGDDQELADRLQEGIAAVNALRPGAYRPAKVRTILQNATQEERSAFADALEAEVVAAGGVSDEADIVDAEVVGDEPNEAAAA